MIFTVLNNYTYISFKNCYSIVVVVIIVIITITVNTDKPSYTTHCGLEAASCLYGWRRGMFILLCAALTGGPA